MIDAVCILFRFIIYTSYCSINKWHFTLVPGQFLFKPGIVEIHIYYPYP